MMKLSIVTVCYNAEKCLGKTILSVLNQRKNVYEYVIIDGRSEDHTLDIIEKYKKPFERKGIKYLYISEKDKGISDAFNKGIKLSTGNLIGLINADDELLPDTCKILESEWNKFSADIYYGNCVWVDTVKNVEYVSKPKSHNYEDLLYRMILIHPSTFVRKDAYERIGLFDITYKYCMDVDLLYKMYKGGASFHYVDEVLTRFKSGGVSDRNAVAVHKEVSRMSLSYGAPKFKVKTIEYKKRIRSFFVRLLKKTPIFYWLKKAKKCDTEK